MSRTSLGEVYRARDPRLGRDVAIKVLPQHLAADHDALARFEREARAVAALSHPNILSIYDVGSDSGVTYAVMELLEGESLRSRLARGPLSWRRCSTSDSPGTRSVGRPTGREWRRRKPCPGP